MGNIEKKNRTVQPERARDDRDGNDNDGSTNPRVEEMRGEIGAVLRRLALAVLVAALLSAVFDWAMKADGLPLGMQMMALGFAFALAAAIYVFLIPILYFVALGADTIGIARWIVFPILFVALNAGYSYVSLSGFRRYEIGAGILVMGGKLTALGWTYWEQNIAGTAAIALIVDIILFGWPSRWLRNGAGS